MDLSQLSLFTTIAQLENLSRAAEVLHVSQPSLSKNLAKLEEELGTPLFDRCGKKIALNEAGRRFLDYCNLTLRELESVEDDIQLIATGSNNRIRIGLSSGTELMLSAMADFRRTHPESSFETFTGFESEDIPDINRYDVLIYPDEPKYKKFSGYFFFKERYLLAVPELHPLAQRSVASLDALDGENLLFLRSGKSNAENALRVCMALSVKPATHSFTDSRALHAEMIASGLGIGFVPEGSAAYYRGCGGIRLIPLIDNRLTRSVNICFRREKHLSGSALEFCAFLRERFHLE